jgi:hypothetical protein
MQQQFLFTEAHCMAFKIKYFKISDTLFSISVFVDLQVLNFSVLNKALFICFIIFFIVLGDSTLEYLQRFLKCIVKPGACYRKIIIF